jgi:signal peptidase II
VKRRDRLFVLLWVVGLTCGVDQATKRMATEHLRGVPPTSYFGDLFRLGYAENPGAFLGLGTDLAPATRNGLLTVGVGLVLLGLLAHLLLAKRLTRLTVVAYALILGGGGSNWMDRLTRHGLVVDFMNVGIGSLRSGIFNFADLAIDASFVLLLLQWNIERRRGTSSRNLASQ